MGIQVARPSCTRVERGGVADKLDFTGLGFGGACLIRSAPPPGGRILNASARPFRRRLGAKQKWSLNKATSHIDPKAAWFAGPTDLPKLY
jgi:hypothetical protein